MAWTESRHEQVKHFKYWVYIAIDAIATKIASMRPNVSWLDQSPSPRPKSRAITPLQTHERLVPAPSDHPLVRLLADPNDPDTSYDLWYETLLFLELTGSSYWWVPRNRLGIPEAIWVIPSHWMWPLLGKKKLIEAYEMRPVEGHYLRKRFPPEEVIHFRRKSPISKLDGHSPLQAVDKWIDIQEALNTAQWYSYQQGPFQNVVIQFDAQMQDPTSEHLDRIEQKFFARFGSPTKAGKPLILPPGVKASPLTITPNQMLFGETEASTRDRILAAYRVPPVIAGIAKQATYGSILASQVAFMSFCINPRCDFLGQIISEKLGPAYDGSPRVWWEDGTPDDPQQVEQQIRTDAQYQAITPNEIRALRGREPFPDPKYDRPLEPPGSVTSPPKGGEHSNAPPPSSNQNPDYPRDDA